MIYIIFLKINKELQLNTMQNKMIVVDFTA